MTWSKLRCTCPHCAALLEFLDAPADATGVCAACEQRLVVCTHGHVDVKFADRHARAAQHIGRVSVERILVDTMDLFRHNAWVLLGVSCLTTLIWFALVALPGRMLWPLWENAEGDLPQAITALVATLVVGLVGVVTTAYTMSVMARTTLRVARYGKVSGTPDSSPPISLGTLAVPPRVMARMTGFVFLTACVVLILFLGGLVGMIVCTLVLSRETAPFVGVMGVGGVLFFFFFVLQWLWWPSVFLIADECTSFMRSLSQGPALSWRNASPSLKTVTAYFVLSTVGALMFYVGQAITAPLATLPLAITYLRMTGGQSAAEKNRNSI